VDNHQVVAKGPKREMLELWHNRLGAGDAGGARVAQDRRTRTEAGVRAKEGPPQVELSQVTVKGAKRRILRDISWTLRAGECWALLGPNGAGKTTLLNLIQGDHPQVYAVDIRYFGHRADSTQRVWRARRHIGWMSPELHQHYPGSWSAEDTVCSGFFNSVGLHEACSPRQRRQARRCLAELGLGSLAGTPFGELSFGQQRLLLLARSVVKKPRVLILDEPCQGLDAGQRRTLLEAVDRLVLQTGTSLIFVTHHQDEMPGCITHVLRLSAGRIRSAVRRK
jgi:molybdate transport system ATP-binding protein